MRRLTLLALSTVSLGALSTPAFAQTPATVTPGGDPCEAPAAQADKALCPDTADQADPSAPATTDVVEGQADSGEAIVVTGSRIRRDSFNTGDNLNVINREEAKQAGFASTTETLQSNSVTAGTAQVNNTFSGFVTDGGPGANTLSLRGLGPTRTLILLNGRRIAPAGTRGSVGSADLNVLPTAIIDRIEILKAGASSIYGSDAIAGVVNVLTRTNVKGVTLEGQVSVPQVGAGATRRISMLAGAGGDNWQISGTVEYLKRDEMERGDRDFTRCPRDLLRTATDRTPGAGDFIDPLTGESKCFTLSRTGSQGSSVNTIGLGGPRFNNADPIGGRFGGFRPGVELANGFPIPPAGRTIICDRYRFDPTATGAIPGVECVNGFVEIGTSGTGAFSSINIRDTYDPAMDRQTLISPAELLTGYLQGTVDTAALGNAQFYGEVLASRRKSSSKGFRQLTLDYGLGSPLIPANLANPAVFVPFLNAGNSLVTPLIPNPNVPGTFITAPTQVRSFIGFGNLGSSQNVDYVRAVAGMRGDFFIPGWKYDATLMKSWTDAEYGQETFLTSRVAQSLAATGSLATGFTCVNTANGCVAAPFVNADSVAGNLSQAYRNFVVQNVVGNTKFRETTFLFGIDGPIFALPGGDASVFLGAEYRRSKIDDTPGAASQSGDLYNLTTSSPTRGSDRVWEVFGEIELPLLRNAPLVYDLTLNGSARYTNYRSYGADNTYKLGGQYSPVKWMTFRGNYGTSYRAPALFEQFLGATSGFLSQAGDPCNNYTGPTVGATRRANCASEGLPTTFVATQGITVLNAGGAASGLDSEKSTSWSVGGVLQPDLGDFGRLSLAVDYFRTQVNNGVSRLATGTILSLCYDDPDFRSGGQGFCNLVTRNPSSRQLTVNNNFVNVSADVVRGIDFNGRYQVNVGPGALRLGGQATKFLDQSTQNFPGSPLTDFNGTVNNPKWSATFDANYRVGRVDFNYGLDWTAKTSDYEILGVDPAVEPRVLDTPGYYLHRASVRFQLENYGFIVGVRNMFDKEPPEISTGRYNLVGNAPLYSGYDYQGRTFFVNVTAKLDKLGSTLGL